MTEYESDPEEATTLAVNAELLPPPCSIWSVRAMSRTSTSSFVKSLSGLSMDIMFSVMPMSGFGRRMMRWPLLS